MIRTVTTVRFHLGAAGYDSIVVTLILIVGTNGVALHFIPDFSALRMFILKYLCLSGSNNRICFSVDACRGPA